MPNIYTKEQLWEIYKSLPEQIKEYLSSEKASSIIENIFEENKVSGPDKSFITDAINQVLFGLIPPEEFQKVLEEKMKGKELAKALFQSINRYVFFPVKEYLKTTEKKIVEKTEIKPEKAVEEENKETPKIKKETNDTYRESVE
jgi:hypothetical protein